MKALKVTCKVIVRDNKLSLIIPESYQEYKKQLLEYCVEKRGGFISLSLSPPKRPRSTGKGSQSHHLNGHCQQIATIIGQPFEDIKKYVKQQAISMGYPILETENGDNLCDMWGNLFGISEADSTVEQCKLLIDQVHQLADELGIKLEEGE